MSFLGNLLFPAGHRKSLWSLSGHSNPVLSSPVCRSMGIAQKCLKSQSHHPLRPGEASRKQPGLRGGLDLVLWPFSHSHGHPRGDLASPLQTAMSLCFTKASQTVPDLSLPQQGLLLAANHSRFLSRPRLLTGLFWLRLPLSE